MQSRVTITQAELLEALREAAQRSEEGPEGAYTTEELAELTGIYRGKVKETIRALIRLGKAECVHVRRPSIDGRMFRVPAYRIKSL